MRVRIEELLNSGIWRPGVRAARAAVLLACLGGPVGCQSAGPMQGLTARRERTTAKVADSLCAPFCNVRSEIGNRAAAPASAVLRCNGQQRTDSGQQPGTIGGATVVKIGPPVGLAPRPSAAGNRPGQEVPAPAGRQQAALAHLPGPVTRVACHDVRPALPAALSPQTGGLGTEQPVEPDGPDKPIDLVAALNMAGVSNPTIGRALEEINAARGDLLGALALMLPTLNAGASIDLHEGTLQNSFGQIRDLRRGALEIGAGVGTRAAETTPIPGVRIFAQVAEAIYEPQAARNVVAARDFNAAAVRNNILMDVAVRYLDLAGAQARLQAIRQSQRDLDVLVKMLVAGAQPGVGQWRPADANRVSTAAMLLKTEEQTVEGDVAVASARLAELLSVDPALRLRVADQVLPLLNLVDPAMTLKQLLMIARSNRPEVGVREAEIRRAQVRLREEKVRPLVPLLSVGYTASQFGGGSDIVQPHWGKYSGRQDIDVFAVWSLQNLGFGNLGLIRERRGEIGVAEAQLVRQLNAINEEVTSAYAEVEARRRELNVALRQVETSIRGYDLEIQRARNLQGLPIESLNSLNLLRRAREELVRVVTQYSQAEVRLFVALGQPPNLSPNGPGGNGPGPAGDPNAPAPCLPPPGH